MPDRLCFHRIRKRVQLWQTVYKRYLYPLPIGNHIELLCVFHAHTYAGRAGTYYPITFMIVHIMTAAQAPRGTKKKIFNHKGIG